MTNLEKIRQMSDEELAKLVKDFGISPCGFCNKRKTCRFDGDCTEVIKAWLNSEVEE